ncbi:hypothetical protein BN1051_03283 [Arthrobacter saudimassiliensis]|uniref:DUF3800 domain-containing protein n=1 Tax=Arthrobacter saudimassiliensis TaxID=1461584 RepID=A0A078MU74_9MICC|nr:hypothetical protein BN1051_03283 [Arthrobacter saudimassiliensis]
MTNLYAYVDETGDPGGSAESSPVFGMAALLVDDVGAAQVQAAVQRLRREFSIPEGTPLSWKRHVRTHEKRKYVAQQLAALIGVKVIYVYCRKSDVTRGTFVRDRGTFYNYIAGKTYKGILWAANHWDSEPAKVWTRFGQVMGFDHQATTKPYFERALFTDRRVPAQIEQGLKWVAAHTYAESQAADLYAGFIKAATWPDEYGNVEGQYLRTVWHQIRNSEVCAVPLGLMSVPDSTLVTANEWFPCGSCRYNRAS